MYKDTLGRKWCEMADLIAIAVIVLILGLAIRYIYKEKKKGTHCIGCPMAGSCHKSEKCKSNDNNVL
jgi:hypothetical protein